MVSEKITVKVAIPGRFSGEFIGRQGSTRQHLQNTRDVKFWIDGDATDDVRIIRIFGGKEQAYKFKEYVFQVVRRMAQLENSRHAPACKPDDMDMALLNEVSCSSGPVALDTKPASSKKRKAPPTPSASPPPRRPRRESSPPTRTISQFQLVYLSPLQTGCPLPIYLRAGILLHLVEDLLPHIGLKTSQDLWSELDNITKSTRFSFVNGQDIFRASGLEKFANVKGPLPAVPVDVAANKWSHLKCEL